MMNKIRKINFKVVFLISFWFLSLIACSSNNERNNEEKSNSEPKTIKKNKKEKVKIAIVKPQSFLKETLSQGKIQAKNKIEVGFGTSGKIKNIHIQTGKFVNKGDLLAELEDFNLQHEFKKLEEQISKAKLDLEEKLISLGLETDIKTIDPQLKKRLETEFNLNSFELDKQKLIHDLQQTKIYAPISGIALEVEAKIGSQSSDFKKLCTLLDPNSHEVIFPILESELSLIKEGQNIRFHPLYQNSKNFTGKIKTIIPQVNEHGMLSVIADIKGSKKGLLEGMQVQISIQKQVPNQIVVPKSTIVDRQGKYVVFKYKKGEAFWTYVELDQENADSYSLKKGLKAGDTIIIENNFYLSHLEEVEIQ